MRLATEAVIAAGERIGLTADVLTAVRAMATRIETEASLTDATRGVLAELLHGATTEGIARARATAAALAVEDARTYFLVIALAQVPFAEARHAARGIDATITRRTMADLSVWARHFAKQVGARGITPDILDWSQRYLRGDLLRIESLQLELMALTGRIRVLRDRRTGVLSAVDLEGRAIDLATGEVTSERPSHEPSAWELVLEPGTPVLDMHVPADSMLSLRRVASSIRAARAVFARLQPEVHPVAVAGEAWILDPQIRDLLPHNTGIHALQSACRLYPSALPEAKTIRRLFGPDVQRADLAALPRDPMTSLQRAVVDFLAPPSASLRARGGFILIDELERLEVYRT